MEYYGLGAANTSDFLIPKPEFERLCEVIPEGRFTTVHNEKGVRLGTYAFYVSLLGFSYYDSVLSRFIAFYDGFFTIIDTLFHIKYRRGCHSPYEAENSKRSRDR